MINIENFDVVIVDAYGVFNFGQGISQSVIETFKTWKAKGKQVYILSNTSSTIEKTVQSYEKKGVIKGVHYTNLMTAGQYASEVIKQGELPVIGNKFYVLGTANFKSSNPVPSIFTNSSYELVPSVEKADFIYCGTPQLLDANGVAYDSTEVSDFTELVAALAKTGLPLVCANPDLMANEGGRFVVRQGTIAKIWPGKVIMYGKPDPRVFNSLLNRYCPNVPKDRILMVGDTLRTDILGAKLTGIKSCLVLEGGITEYEMKRDNISLEAYILKQSITPDFIYDRVSKAPLF